MVICMEQGANDLHMI